MILFALFELAVLLFLFLLLRRLLVQFFRVSRVKVDLGEASYRAMRRYQSRYYLILIGLALFFSAIAFGALDFAVLEYHQHATEAWRLALERTSLVLPALLVGLSLSTQLADGINDYFQKDGLGFYLVELQEWREGFSFRRLRAWHLGLSLVLLLPLIYAQFNSYLELNANSLVSKQNFGEPRVVPHGQWHWLEASKRPAIATSAGDTLYLDSFRLSPEFLARLAQKSSP